MLSNAYPCAPITHSAQRGLSYLGKLLLVILCSLLCNAAAAGLETSVFTIQSDGTIGPSSAVVYAKGGYVEILATANGLSHMTNGKVIMIDQDTNQTISTKSLGRLSSYGDPTNPGTWLENWYALFPIPLNRSQQPHHYKFIVTANADVWSVNTSGVAYAPNPPLPTSITNSYTVIEDADTTPPVISNLQISPTVLPATGGWISVSVNVTDGTGFNDTDIYQIPFAFLDSNGTDVYDNYFYHDGLGMTKPPNHVYTVQFPFFPLLADYGIVLPSIFTPKPYTQTFHFVMGAADFAGNWVGNQFYSISVPITILPNEDFNPPVITNASVSPPTLPGSSGGPITIKATVTDNGPQDTRVCLVSASIGNQHYTMIKDPSSNVYSTTVSINPSLIGHSQSTSLLIKAWDNVGNVATAYAGSYTLGGNFPNLTVQPVGSSSLINSVATISLIVSNASGIAATDCQITAATLSTGSLNTPLPLGLGTIYNSDPATFNLTFTNTKAGTATLRVRGTYQGGTFSAAFRVTL